MSRLLLLMLAMLLPLLLLLLLLLLILRTLLDDELLEIDCTAPENTFCEVNDEDACDDAGREETEENEREECVDLSDKHCSASFSE